MNKSRSMSIKHSRAAHQVVTVLAGVMLAIAVPARAAFYELAQTNFGATVSYNGSNGWYSGAAGFAIDGTVQPDHLNCASWPDRTSGSDAQKAWLRVNLPAVAAQIQFVFLKLFERQNSDQHAAPFEIKVYDANDNVLETFTYSGSSVATYTFTNTTSATGASYLVYRHTGASADNLFISEVQALFTGDCVICVNGFGTNSLNSANLVGGAVGGGLANVQAVRFVQNSNTSDDHSCVRARFTGRIKN